MADTIDVEAKPIDNELDTMTKADLWLAKASERVAKRCELYKPPKRIENDKMRSDATSARTQVRKDKDEIDAERKAMLRELEDRLKDFKANVKDVLSPLSDLDAEYKRLLDEYEEAWRTERVIELTHEYEDMAPDLVPLVPFERLMEHFGMEKGKVWTNRTTNLVAVKQMIGQAIDAIAEDEKTIRKRVDEEDVKDTLVTYFNTLDLRRTLASADKLHEQRERLAQLEAERAAREEQWANPQPVVEENSQPPVEDTVQASAPATDVPMPRVLVIPYATKHQMLQMRDFMRSIGVTGGSIYSGTLEQVYERVVGNA